MATERKNYNFAAGFYIYRHDFPSGGSVLNVSGDYSQFTAWLKTICDEQGRFRMVIAEKREQVERKPTHIAYEDTWKPKPKPDEYDQRVPDRETERPARVEHGSAAAQEPSDDNLPF